VLLCEGGHSDREVAGLLPGRGGPGRGGQVGAAVRPGNRLAGLADLPRCGARRTITDTQVDEVVVKTPESAPDGATHRSRRELAKQVGMSASSVFRVWRASKLMF
jgi:hypothetical protein